MQQYFNRSNPIITGLGVLALTFSALSVSGCDSGSDNPEEGASEPPPTGSDPLYALMVQVYTPDDRIVYAYLTKDIDELGEIDLADAREFASVANFAGIDGRLLISSGTEPEITEFGISDDLEWTEGRTVSFADYPLDDNANFYYQYILDDETAYLPYNATSRVVWNPSEMVIEEQLEDTEIPREIDGLTVTTGGNRNAIQFDGPVQQPFFYVDENWSEYGGTSYVAIYDAESDEEDSTIELPCPALSMASQDGDYTYYGTWSFHEAALFGEGPDPCIVRLDENHELDEDWTTDLTEATEGRLHNNFRAVGDGRAIANVFHDEIFLEEHPDMTFDDGYDSDVVDALYTSGPWWKLWLFDIESATGAPVEGIDVDTTSGAQFAVLDGRTFVFLPYDDWGRTKIFEIDEDGQATEHGDTVGDVFKWIRVR